MDNNLGFRFEYINELGETTKLERNVTYNPDIVSEFDMMIEEYKQFLLACGFSQGMVSQICY